MPLSAFTHSCLFQDCPSSSLNSRTGPSSSEPQVPMPHKDVTFSTISTHLPFKNGNDPSPPLPSSPLLIPAPFPHTAAHYRAQRTHQFLPICYGVALGVSCDMLDKLKSFWETEIWQIEGMRTKSGDIFFYHWSTGHLFSVWRMSATWKHEMVTIQYFRALHCLM